ncbi:HD domain-containing phosphohydrolase [Thermincola ferriacetica]
MAEKLMQELLGQVPWGYAYHQPVLNNRGEPEDYIFLEVNPAFELMTGLQKNDILGKRVTEVLPGIRSGSFDWVSFYGQVALTGEKQEIIHYAEPLDRWYRITAISSPKQHIVTFLQDISDEIKQIKEREDLLQRLQAMFNGHTAVMLLIEPVTGQIKDANPAACSFYGYTRQELLSMRIQDINMLPGEEVERRRLMALKKKQKYFLFPHRLKSGEIRLVDIYSCPIDYGGEKLLFSIIIDVTEREKYREELYREKELLRTTLVSIGDAVVCTDEKGRITIMNKVAGEITGWSEEEARGKMFDQVFRLVSEETGEVIENPVAKVLQTGKTAGPAPHTALITREGRQVPIVNSAAPIKDEKENIFGVVMVFRDITREKRKQEEILYLSYHDPLTGLYNRRFAEEEIKRLDTSRELPLAVIIGDVNGLKLTNDIFGHEEGDRLLKKAAKVIKKSCRKENIIARWGGDEFLILLPRTDARTAEKTVGRINSKCGRDGKKNIRLSISLGYAVKTKATENLWQKMKEAEEGMYHQKLLEQKSYRNNLINALLTTMAEKSTETEEHAWRLKKYCLELGGEFGLSGLEMEQLALLAILHDIGKVGISESILKKPGPLTPKEWAEIKKHSEIGWRIARNIPEMSTVAEYILLHHERWDGQGYPRGLKGEEIPLLCRILAVADAYDAMTGNRSYRPAMSSEEALAELQRNAGTQFDPEVVKKFINCQQNIKTLLKSRGLKLRRRNTIETQY